jgi:hypothetical protein
MHEILQEQAIRHVTREYLEFLGNSYLFFCPSLGSGIRTVAINNYNNIGNNKIDRSKLMTESTLASKFNSV